MTLPALPLAGAPLTLQKTMADIGPVWGSNIQAHSDMVKKAYAPLLAAAPKDGITVTRNIAYGAHARQVADIFQPANVKVKGNAGGAPVVVFVHGGAFVRGDKRTSDEIYDNVMYWFARQGYLGINIEYRLAPDSPYPGGADDIAAAMAWLHANVAHDLAGPLTSISGFIDTIANLDEKSNQTEKEKYFGIIRKNLKTLSRLVAELGELQADLNVPFRPTSRQQRR